MSASHAQKAVFDRNSNPGNTSDKQWPDTVMTSVVRVASFARSNTKLTQKGVCTVGATTASGALVSFHTRQKQSRIQN